MKIIEIKIGTEVLINGHLYAYKGIQKIRMVNIGKVQKIVFERREKERYDYKYFDLPVGNTILKEEGGQLVFTGKKK